MLDRIFTGAVVALALLLTGGVAQAQSGCTGQFQAGQVCNNPGTTTASPSGTSSPVIGNPGVTSGSLGIASSSGGTATIRPPAVAGNTTFQLPTSGGTFAASGTSPIVLGANGAISCPTCLSSGSSFANPTASVGLTAVNGSALTVMRSDAAPPLSSAVQTALTGTNHALALGTGAFGFSSAGPCTASQLIAWPSGATSDPSCITGLPSGSLANPTAAVGLTAVNGSATTAMRSDGAPALSQAIVPTWTAKHIFANASTSQPAISIPSNATVNGTAQVPGLSLTSAGLGQGLNFSQSGTGLATGLSLPPIFNSILISENIDNGAGFVDGFTVAQVIQGSGAKGGREALKGLVQLNSATDPANTNHNFVGVVGICDGFANDNGGSGTETGACFGAGLVAVLSSAGTHYFNLTGAEFNTAAQTGSSVKYKSLAQFSGRNDDAVAGSTVNAMLWLYNQSGAVSWNDGILFDTPSSGQWPISTSGTIIRTAGSNTVTNGIDLSATTFSGSAFKSNAFSVNGSGNVSGAQFVSSGVGSAGAVALGIGATTGFYVASGALDMAVSGTEVATFQNSAAQGFLITGSGSGSGGGGFFGIQNGGSNIILLGNVSGVLGGTYNSNAILYAVNPLAIYASGSLEADFGITTASTWTFGAAIVGASTIRANTGFNVNGSAGVTTTCTVTVGNTLVFTGGILTTKGANCT